MYYARFSQPEVIINESPLKRRILRFYLVGATLVLDSDVDQERKSARHKFRDVYRWDRLEHRRSPQRPVPATAIGEALSQIRNQIRYQHNDEED